MNSLVLRSFPDILGAEGYTRWMYSDKAGNVTVGRGNFLESPEEALHLPWQMTDGSAADESTVRTAWKTVKDHGWLPSGGASREAQSLTAITLTDAATKAAVAADVASIAHYVQGHSPWIVDLPADAQMAVLRWAWAMGPDPVKARNMFKALRAGDFEAAAKLSHWIGEDDAVYQLITQLLTNASYVSASNLDKTVLVWPQTVGNVNVAVAEEEEPDMGVDYRDATVGDEHTFTNEGGPVEVNAAHSSSVDPSVIDPFGLGATAAAVRTAAQQAQQTAVRAGQAIDSAQETATAARAAIDEGKKYASDADTAVKVGLGLALAVVGIKLFTGYLDKKASR